MIVAKYKFDKSIYENLIPVFNDGYNGYTITDEIDGENSNHIIRTIECDVLPTRIGFGYNTSSFTVTAIAAKSLLEVLEINVNITDMQYMFSNCTNLTSLDVSNWDTSKVTNMSAMFWGCSNLTLLDVSNFDTSNVIDMYAMFYGCRLLTELDVSNFDTSKVTNMVLMFYECKNLTSLDLSNFNTSNVTNMQQMFLYCYKLTSLDVSNFDTSKVTNMQQMFSYCQSLSSLDLSNFNTSNVTNMQSMFNNCTSLTSLDVSNWDTGNVTNMTSIFNSTSNLQYIRCNNTSTINTLAPLLYNRTSSTQGKIITTSSTNVDTTALSSLNWSVDTSSGTKIAEYKYDKSIWNSLVPEFNEGYSGYFCNDVIEDEVNSPNVVTRELVGYGGLPTLMRFGQVYVEGEIVSDASLSLLEIYQADTSNITNAHAMFRNCRNMISISELDTSNVTNMQNMFVNCINLTSLDLSNFNTSNVTNMNGMFLNCKSLTSLDVSNFDTSKVTNMYGMFNSCKTLTSLNVSNFDTSKVTSMNRMFSDCKNLTSLDVSNFNTSNVTTMQGMFYNCNNLTSLDVSSWNTSNVTSMSNIFNGCTNLIELVGTSNWNTSKVINMEYMFYECKNLKSLDLNNWNVSNVKYMFGLFYACSKLSSLDLSNWNTRSANNMGSMLNRCYSMTFLDISNWDTTYTDVQNLLTTALTDIGMLYCSQDTINKVITSINSGNMTIWVKDTKASDYTATDYVTIKDYKEDNRTLYLNSPLLEGDEIVNKEGKLYHYHKMGKEVLDGSKVLFTVVGENYQPTNTNFINFHYLNNNIKKRGEVYSNNFKYVFFGVSSDADTNCIWTHGSNNSIRLCIDKSKLQTTDENGLKQWLQANPTTIVYELTEPYYELISDDPLIVQSYAEGKLDTSSIITPTSIQSIPYEEELTYLYTSTQYCIQFNSTANCTVDITLGGTKVENKSVLVGLNKIYITTPSTLVDNKLIINAKGSATISEVVVVNSNAEFDYFDGLKSSFEDCLVTDVDNENYGKYEVGVKIVGKNLFNVYGNINEYYSSLTDTDYAKRYNHQLLDGGIIKVIARTYNHYTRGQIIKVKRNTNYAVKFGKVENVNHRWGLRVLIETLKNEIIHRAYNIKTNHEEIVFNSLDNDYVYFTFAMDGAQDDTMYSLVSNIQLEEGDTATAYEPYKETNATIYLNSPLLKGDRIEVVDGKLCHYHKMGKVMLNGSGDDEIWNKYTNYNSNILDHEARTYTKVISNTM